MDIRKQEAYKLIFFPVQINGKISAPVREAVPRHLGCKRWDNPVWY